MSSIAIAAFAVYPYAYRDETHRAAVEAGTAESGAAIPGLQVFVPSRRVQATWHSSTGLYGFTGLFDGPQLLHITDPLRRYVPRTVVIQAPARAPIAEAVRRQAAEPPAAPKPTLLPVPMRPGHRFGWARGETVFRGTVTEIHRGVRVPAPFARVETHRGGRLTHLLHCDETGRFALWLREEVAPLTGSPPDVQLSARARRERPPEPGDPLVVQPGGFDTLGASDVASLYGPPGPPLTQPVVVGTEAPLTLNL